MSLLSHYSDDYKERLACICKTGIIFFKQKIIDFFLGDFGVMYDPDKFLTGLWDSSDMQHTERTLNWYFNLATLK